MRFKRAVERDRTPGSADGDEERQAVTPETPDNDCFRADECRRDNSCQYYRHCAQEAWY